MPLLPFVPTLQEAAGLFQYLRENECNKVDAPRPTDLSTECVSLLEKLMLAQAQVWGKCGARCGHEGGGGDVCCCWRS